MDIGALGDHESFGALDMKECNVHFEHCAEVWKVPLATQDPKFLSIGFWASPSTIVPNRRQ